MRSAGRIIAAVLLCAPLSACLAVAAGAGAGTYAYFTGELKADIEAPLPRAVAGAERACQNLQFKDVATLSDALEAKVTAAQADDTDITIKLIRKTDTTTEARIRVGTFGDEKKSTVILEEIKKSL